MTTNLLIAIKNIVESPLSNIVYHNNSSNRANLAGDSLELYIKDVFCSSLQTETDAEKNKIFSQNFSYIGNQNNPPDLIIKNGDAVEVKKNKNFSISDVSIKSPNNPANLLDATLISFGIKT